jgi:hypothetical protein
MTTIDDQGRPEPTPAAGEVEAALGFLDFQRATLEWRCSRLDAQGLSTRVAASTMTLGGLMKHMAWVEDYWFSRRLCGLAPSDPWASAPWDVDRDWEWTSAAADTPDELLTLWRANVERSRQRVAEVLADTNGDGAGGGFDRLAAVPWDNGDAPNLRWIVLHMIEEYARHNGHADLIREAVDGETGE